jgi:hypothetical protein
MITAKGDCLIHSAKLTSAAQMAVLFIQADGTLPAWIVAMINAPSAADGLTVKPSMPLHFSPDDDQD